jgi:hypothetical protein
MLDTVDPIEPEPACFPSSLAEATDLASRLIARLHAQKWDQNPMREICQTTDGPKTLEADYKDAEDPASRPQQR